MGGAGNVAGAVIWRIPMELSWRLTIPTRAAHSDCGVHGRLWCFISGRVVFTRVVLIRIDDFAAAGQTPCLAG